MSVEYVPSSSIDDLEERLALAAATTNPYSNKRRFGPLSRKAPSATSRVLLAEESRSSSSGRHSSDMPKAILASNVSAAREASIQRRKFRLNWFEQNMPPIQFMSMSFSMFLIVSVLGYQLGFLDTFRQCKIMAYGSILYFGTDSVLEILVFDRWSYILHHIVALGAFYFIGNAEEFGYSAPYIEMGSNVLMWMEISTVFLNIRRCVAPPLPMVMLMLYVCWTPDTPSALPYSLVPSLLLTPSRLAHTLTIHSTHRPPQPPYQVAGAKEVDAHRGHLQRGKHRGRRDRRRASREQEEPV